MGSIRRYEQKLAQQRVTDEARANLSAYLATDKMLHENFRSDERVVAQRYNKEQRVAAKERHMSEQLAAAAEANQRERMIRDADQRISAALAKSKNDQMRDQKNVARVCQQSEELRELEAKLKAAYMNKEREAQIVESAALAAEQDAQDAIVAGVMEEERLRGLQAEAYRDYLRKQDGEAMRVALDGQMMEKEQRKAKAYEEFLKEKDMVDKVVAAILEEDAEEREVRRRTKPGQTPTRGGGQVGGGSGWYGRRSHHQVAAYLPNRVHSSCTAPQARHRKEAETRRFIDEFVAAREAHKAERMDEIARENDEIRAYADKVMVRETELRMAREREQNAKDAILEQLSAEMSARQVRGSVATPLLLLCRHASSAFYGERSARMVPRGRWSSPSRRRGAVRRAVGSCLSALHVWTVIVCGRRRRARWSTCATSCRSRRRRSGSYRRRRRRWSARSSSVSTSSWPTSTRGSSSRCSARR